jgi:hypothetical protein
MLARHERNHAEGIAIRLEGYRSYVAEREDVSRGVGQTVGPVTEGGQERVWTTLAKVFSVHALKPNGSLGQLLRGFNAKK